ncbi:MAG: tetratricopeptide repeat protein [Candidatus Omnitrophica bacterium]|nr:tetratricopeptide repeat protein [Candidatus Omnitrophota bacterium]MDD5553120.1 tetratricopeptide repeat protein [Candidatus Omnitrophota bacterium]
MKRGIFSSSLCTLLLLQPFGVCSGAEIDERFQQAQQHYYHENYEEALEMFKTLKSGYPGSSEIAFYLGMTYKRMQDYRSAQPFLAEACSLKPRIDAALPELIELLYQNDRLNEAQEWIGVAEHDFIAPGQIAFLKGMVLLKQEKIGAALKAFDDAEKLEPSLASSVAYQKAIALSQKKDYAQAREQLRGVVIKDPGSDLAAFANEYIDTLKRKQRGEQRLKGSASYSVQYDDNVTFKPNDSALVSDTTGERDWLQMATAQLDWALKPIEMKKTALNAVYSFYTTKHNDVGLYDAESHDISVQPAYYGRTVTFAMPVHYNYVTLNEDPYLDTVGASALLNISDNFDKMWQLQLQYNHYDYHWLADNERENRDTDESSLSLGRYWFWDSSGYLNLNYSFNYSDAKGRNWEYFGNRIVLTVVVPLREGLQWNFVADYFRQNFMNTHSTYNNKRDDDLVTVSNLLVKELSENIQLQAQHTFVYDDSNIGLYKYKKNTYSLGVKCWF